MQETEVRHEEVLAQAQAKNEEYSAYIMQLKNSLFTENGQRMPTDLRVSFEENTTLRRKVHDLEDTLRSFQVQITGLEHTIRSTRENAPAVGATTEEPLYPEGFAPRADHEKAPTIGVTTEEPLYPLGFTPPHVRAQQGAQQAEDVLYFSQEGRKESSEQFEEKWKQLEEEIRAMKEDTRMYGIDAKELSLVPDLVLPPKFKVPEFEKFDDTRYLFTHITMFCRKMIGDIGDDQLLIHCFQ
ncbi:uncharacterized protein LOC120124743 [Hibiscus syriacus]|uniref:uncharacterized protein LOC120124743 n=1 Tax=Hibiscus syriacus TaxID=106335 RepID=UPI0019223E82|nr:uncharacterized protein LOC120124743 [Hibiscus syriacus]